MPDLTELLRLAEEGQWMPADTAKKLIAVALLADALVNPPQMATGYDQRKQREADEAALLAALEELK